MRRAMLVLGIGMATVSAFAAEATNAERLKCLGIALQDGGVTGVLSVASARGWLAPEMPSKWHVETRMKNEDDIRAANAARDFGHALAQHLEPVAQQFQELPPDGDLCARAHLLCDLADWCAGADGAGNLLLAQRCLDIAAVGLGRVTANLDFPLDECKRLASRMSPTPEWAGVKKRCRVLDVEAGTNLFATCRTQEDMARVWEAGVRLWGRETLLQAKARGEFIPPRHLLEDKSVPKPLLQAAEGLFEMPEQVGHETPITCRTYWNLRNHSLFTVELEPHSVRKALELLKFREAVGYFPEKLRRTPEEIKKRDEEIIKLSKWGIKMTKWGIKMTKAEDDPSYDPLREAFRRTWRADPDRDREDYNGYSPAYWAYKEITSGTFYDRDTANIRDVEAAKRWKEEQQHPKGVNPPPAPDMEKLKEIWEQIESKGR